MQPFSRLVAAWAFGAMLIGCSSRHGVGTSSAAVDPSAREALIKAEPLAYGCAYVRSESSSYNDESLGASDETPGCDDGFRCDELDRNDHTGQSVIAGGIYSSHTYYAHPKPFLGTCAERGEPIAASFPTQEPCDMASFLCSIDPNCLAIRDCVVACQENGLCRNRCFWNGDTRASSNLAATAECVTWHRDTPNIQAVFPGDLADRDAIVNRCAERYVP